MFIVLLMIAGAAVAIMVALLVLLRNPTSIVHRWLFVLILSASIWVVSVNLHSEVEERLGVWLLRFAFVATSIVAFSILRFCQEVSERRSGKVVKYVSIGLTILSVALSLSPLVIVDLVHGNRTDGSLEPIRGMAYALVIFIILYLIVYGLFTLNRARMHQRGSRRIQLWIVEAGLVSGTIIGVVSNVVLPNITKTTAPSRFAFITIIILTVSLVYAVVKHRFLDIRLAIARTLSYTMVLAAIVSLYAVIVFGIVGLFFVEQPLNGLTYVYLIAAVFLAFTYAPLKKFFDRVTDRIFFHHDYTPHEVLSSVGDITANEIDLRKLTTKSLTTLRDALKSEFASIYILPVEQETEAHVFHTGDFPKRLSREDEAKIFKTAGEMKDEVIVADQLPRAHQALQKSMNSDNIAVIVKLNTSRELVGHLFFGPKQNGTMYNTKDLQLLKTVGDELALAVQNSLRFKEISEFNVHLQQRIDEATAELQESNKKLQELDEAKDEFISMASHQLRTPLTSVKGYLSMVLEGDAGHVSPKQKRLLEEAFTSSQRMVYLIGDFLNVSRLKTGKFVLEMGTINLADIVADEIVQLQSTADARRLKLKYDKPAHFPAQVADENKLRQVIMNFVDNAIFYSTPGKDISIELTHKGGEVVFKVRDQGIGVPASERHKLFAKFYRASNAKKARPDGTGIGIFMAKKVVVAHGGSIIFESVEGKGSTFGFRLPVKQAVERAVKKPTE